MHSFPAVFAPQAMLKTTDQDKQKPVSPLPGFTRFITSHNDNGKAIIYSEAAAAWTAYEDKTLGFSTVYTTSEFPANLNAETDITKHENTVSSGNLGLVQPGGTVCCIADFCPGTPGIMHRTQSLDYGIVLEGEMEMVLDSGDIRLLEKGDIAVQRATMHCWRNPSPTQWARMMFVLQHCQPLFVGQECLREDLGAAQDIKSSEPSTT